MTIQKLFVGISLALLSACATTSGQTAAPAPAPSEAKPSGDPAPKTEGAVTEAWLNGMQILFKKDANAEFVAGQLVIKGGVYNWDQQTAGIEQLALSTAQSGGTEKLDKDAFARRLAELGSDVGAGAGSDFSAYGFRSLTRNWAETFQLMADAFLIPALPESEIALQRQRQLQSLKREQEFPDSRLGLVTHQRLFEGHPYQHRSIGTPESVAKLTRAQLLAHLAKLRETSRLVLVVVGNLEVAEVLEQARRAFGALPRGEYQHQPLPPLKHEAASVHVVNEQLPTNYITGVFLAPTWKDPEYATALVAMNALRNRVWDEVRTKRNLSYAPTAGITMNSFVPRGSLYVTAVDANTTVKVMLDEARKLGTEPMPTDELNGAKEVFRTSFVSQHETAQGQAGMLMRAQLYGGDWRLSDQIPERIKAVTPEDVRAFAQKYVARLQMVVLGDPAKIDDALFRSL